MQTNNHDNKRIVKNTMMLYIRMILIMVVSLYTSRVILHALGVTNFGIYNVVGGLSVLFTFFSSAFSSATQRFLNFELGKGIESAAKDIFSLSLLIHTVIAISVVIIGCTVGTWYVGNKLVLPYEQIPAARVVLYSMLVSLAFTFIGSVYESVLIARENMKLYAWLGLFDAFAKLGVSYIVSAFDSDRLIIYAVLLASIKILYTGILIFYCRIHYAEANYRYYWDTKQFRKIFSFVGWNVYGTGVWALNLQGVNMLLNWFFGPVINAANAIAQQVNSAVNSFGINFFTAVRPQIVKNYAAQDYDYFKKLVYASSRFGVYLMWIIGLPVIIRTPYILDVWLTNVPDNTVEFVRWTLIFSMINTLSNPLLSAIQATGHLQKPLLYGSTLYMFALPASWLLLKGGLSAEVVFPILILFRIGFIITILFFLGQDINVKIWEWCCSILFRCLMVVLPSFLLMRQIDRLFPQNLMSLILIAIISFFISLMFIWLFGTTRDEHKIISSKLRNAYFSQVKKLSVGNNKKSN